MPRSPSPLAALLCALLAGAAAAAPPAPDSSRSPAPRWALVLSGGAARGLAHIGVLRAIEEEGIRPDLVVGTSMGSLVGALWASGRTSAEIRRMFRSFEVQSLFEPRPRGYEWRRVTAPRPWLTMAGDGRGPRLPSSILDDAYLNFALTLSLLGPEAMAQGDFDRLPVPWRSVTTELQTLSPIVLRQGSVAEAVRASISIPIAFPGWMAEDRLLIDGGLSSHLPISAARDEKARHVLAVDVAEKTADVDERSSVFQLALTLVHTVSRRGQSDTLPGRDLLVRLEMPGIQPMGFGLADRIVATGYRESREIVARAAREWGLPRVAGRADTTVLLPPLRGIEWRDPRGRRAWRSRAARAVFGRPPSGSFRPEELAAGLRRLYESDLFRSAWPRLASDRDSTSLAFVVREHDPWEIAFAAGYEADRGGSAAAGLSIRPPGPLPSLLSLGGSAERLGREAHASFEPRSLARGGRGWFLRAAARRSETRLFATHRDWIHRRTERAELAAGGQIRLPTGDVVQAGGGVARLWEEGSAREGGFAAARLEARGRYPRMLEGSVLGGPRAYASVSGAAGIDLPIGSSSLRPSVRLGWASSLAPHDELHGLGGPASLVGLRDREWLGRTALASELRLVQPLLSGFEAALFGQVGQVGDAVSRADLGTRPRFAGGVALLAQVPLGPLAVSWGVTEGRVSRWDLSFGAAP